MLPVNLHTLVEIALRTGVIYCLVLLGIRLSGKREVGQMTPFDLTLLLLLSNSVQNAMTGPDTSLAAGLVGAVTLFAANFALKWLIFRSRRIDRLLEGEPVMLVYHGHVKQRNLDLVQMSRDELEQTVREHGLMSMSQVDLAVLEVDGNISVLSDEFRKKTLRQRRAHKMINKNQPV